MLGDALSGSPHKVFRTIEVQYFDYMTGSYYIGKLYKHACRTLNGKMIVDEMQRHKIETLLSLY